ncbi:MAG: hypothetical protein RugAbin2_00743 [Rugosibacter sp.]|nr:hypothetical protein [Rugosibacter sp.]
MVSKYHPLMMKHAKGSIKAAPPNREARHGWLCKVGACVANPRPSHPPLAGRLLSGSLRERRDPASNSVVSR